MAEDISMTTAIQQRILTRSRRRQRIDRLLEEITAAELAQSSGQAQYEHNVEMTRRMVDSLRGMR